MIISFYTKSLNWDPGGRAGLLSIHSLYPIMIQSFFPPLHFTQNFNLGAPTLTIDAFLAQFLHNDRLQYYSTVGTCSSREENSNNNIGKKSPCYFSSQIGLWCKHNRYIVIVIVIVIGCCCFSFSMLLLLLLRSLSVSIGARRRRSFFFDQKKLNLFSISIFPRLLHQNHSQIFIKAL
jgi:uncharacterized membrane protein